MPCHRSTSRWEIIRTTGAGETLVKNFTYYYPNPSLV